MKKTGRGELEINVSAAAKHKIILSWPNHKDHKDLSKVAKPFVKIQEYLLLQLGKFLIF